MMTLLLRLILKLRRWLRFQPLLTPVRLLRTLPLQSQPILLRPLPRPRRML
jgi:hypothetical protein